MGSKSRRFTQYSVDAIKKHAEKFPYRTTLAEAEREREQKNTLGGF